MKVQVKAILIAVVVAVLCAALFLFVKSSVKPLRITLSSKLSNSNSNSNEPGRIYADLGAGSYSYFGSAVSVFSDTMVARVELSSYGHAVVYVFEKDADGSWAKSAVLGRNGILAADVVESFSLPYPDAEVFGDVSSLSLDNDTLAVVSGSLVYLFERRSDKSWHRILRITDEMRNKAILAEGDTTPYLSILHPATPYSGSLYPRGFATSVSLDGNMLAVGADQDDDGDPTTGAVYLFEKKKGEWSQVLKISDNDGGEGKLAIDLESDDFFGNAVSLSGNLLAVGAHWDDDGGDDSGAVYLFEKKKGEWSQVLKISDNSGGPGLLAIKSKERNWFGTSVAFSNDNTMLAVGSSSEDAVFIFEKINNVWKQTLKISGHSDDDIETLPKLGYEATYDDVNTVKVALDERGGGGGLGTGFGSSVLFSGNTLMIGDSEDDEGYINAGAVYIFEIDG